MSQEEQKQQNKFWTHNFLDPNFFKPQIFFVTKFLLDPNFFRTQHFFLDPKFFQTQNFFWPKMNFNENDLWRKKTELLYLRLSKLARAKVLFKLEFDTEDHIWFQMTSWMISIVWSSLGHSKNLCDLKN